MPNLRSGPGRPRKAHRQFPRRVKEEKHLDEEPLEDAPTFDFISPSNGIERINIIAKDTKHWVDSLDSRSESSSAFNGDDMLEFDEVASKFTSNGIKFDVKKYIDIEKMYEEEAFIEDEMRQTILLNTDHVETAGNLDFRAQLLARDLEPSPTPSASSSRENSIVRERESSVQPESRESSAQPSTEDYLARLQFEKEVDSATRRAKGRPKKRSVGNEITKKRTSKSKKDEEYEVERILMKKDVKDLKDSFYLIYWRGYTLQETTWQKMEDLSGCDLVIQEFNNRMEVCENIRNIVVKQDCVNYPYKIGHILPITQMNHFKKLIKFEQKLNAINEKNKIAKIFVENWVDDAEFPLNFEFGVINRISESARVLFDPSINDFQDMNCRQKCAGAKKCKKDNCCPMLFEQAYPYCDNKLIVNEKAVHVIECSTNCNCMDGCCSKVLQRGRQVPLVLFRTFNRGWSIRTTKRIEKDTFIMQYVGEVYAYEKCPKDVTYQFAMDTCGTNEAIFCVDSTFYGNEARWVNHSCEPNMRTVGVLASRYDYRYQELGFFALKDIEAGEELTINYCNVLKPCHCNSRQCLAREESVETATEKVTEEIPAEKDTETPTEKNTEETATDTVCDNAIQTAI